MANYFLGTRLKYLIRVIRRYVGELILWFEYFFESPERCFASNNALLFSSFHVSYRHLLSYQIKKCTNYHLEMFIYCIFYVWAQFEMKFTKPLLPKHIGYWKKEYFLAIARNKHQYNFVYEVSKYFIKYN